MFWDCILFSDICIDLFICIYLFFSQEWHNWHSNWHMNHGENWERKYFGMVVGKRGWLKGCVDLKLPAVVFGEFPSCFEVRTPLSALTLTQRGMNRAIFYILWERGFPQDYLSLSIKTKIIGIVYCINLKTWTILSKSKTSNLFMFLWKPPYYAGIIVSHKINLRYIKIIIIWDRKVKTTRIKSWQNKIKVEQYKCNVPIFWE